MSIRTINDHTAVLVGKNINRTASVQVLESTTSATYIADGEIVVTDMDGTVLNTTTVVGKPYIMIRQGRGAANPQITSPVIARSAMKYYRGANYAARTQQVDYIGYNAATTTGSWDVINDNSYVVTITNINSPNYGSTGIQKLGFYTSDAAATHLEINDGMAISLYENTTRTEFEPLFRVERVLSDAGAAIGAAADTVVGALGSYTVTVTDVGSNNSVNPIAAGDYFRAGTAVTSPVYKVLVSTVGTGGGVLTLDQPLQQAVNLVGNTSEFITGALALAADSGIKLTGINQTFSETSRLYYMISRWQTNMINGGDTTIVNQTIPNPGVGEGDQVIQLENQMLGNEGFLHHNTTPYVAPRKDAVTSSTYSFVHLGFNEFDPVGILSIVPNAKEVVIANACTAGSPNTYGTSIQGAASSVVDVLNAWIGTTPGPFTNVTLA